MHYAECWPRKNIEMYLKHYVIWRHSHSILLNHRLLEKYLSRLKDVFLVEDNKQRFIILNPHVHPNYARLCSPVSGCSLPSSLLMDNVFNPIQKPPNYCRPTRSHYTVGHRRLLVSNTPWSTMNTYGVSHACRGIMTKPS